MRRFAVHRHGRRARGRSLGVQQQQQVRAATTTTRPARPRPAPRRGRAAARRCPPRPPTSSRSSADTLSVVTSLPGPGFWEGSDTDPTKLTSGYEYDIAKCMQTTFGLQKLERAQRQLRRDRRRHGHQLRHRALAGLDHARPGQGRRRSPSPTSSRSRACSCGPTRASRTLAEAKTTKWGVQTATTAIDLLEEHRRQQPAHVPRPHQRVHRARGQAGRRGPHRHRDQPR